MEYAPGLASLAAANKSKIKNIRLHTLRDSRCNVDGRSAILSFEKESNKHDHTMSMKIESMQQ